MQAAQWYCAVLYFPLVFSVFGGFLTAWGPNTAANFLKPSFLW